MTISAPVSRWIRIRARQKKASMKEVDRYGRPWMMTSSPRSRPAKLQSAVMNGGYRRQQRWVNHYQNRLIYERAMLDESGGVVTRTQDCDRAGRFSAGAALASHHCEQKQRGSKFSHNAKLQFSRVQRHDESDARSHHGLQSTIGRRAAVARQAAKRPPVDSPGEGSGK